MLKSKTASLVCHLWSVNLLIPTLVSVFLVSVFFFNVPPTPLRFSWIAEPASATVHTFNPTVWRSFKIFHLEKHCFSLNPLSLKRNAVVIFSPLFSEVTFHTHNDQKLLSKFPKIRDRSIVLATHREKVGRIHR